MADADAAGAVLSSPSIGSPSVRKVSHDLIREHVRAARELLDAQNGRVRGPDSRSPTPDPVNTIKENATRPSPSPPPDWPMPPPSTTRVQTPTDQMQTLPQSNLPPSHLESPSHTLMIPVQKGSSVNFNARPNKVLEQSAPELAPSTPAPTTSNTEKHLAIVAQEIPLPRSKLQHVGKAPRNVPPTPPLKDMPNTEQPGTHVQTEESIVTKDNIRHQEEKTLAALQGSNVATRQASKQLGKTPTQSRRKHQEAGQKVLPQRQSASLIAITVKPKLSTQSLSGSSMGGNLELSPSETSPALRNTSLFADNSSVTHLTVPSGATRGSLSTRVGARRPPNLNIAAVREAEARGSMTSLSELIRRALRLASNLERGDTSSKFGNEWLNGNKEKHGSMLHPALRASPATLGSFNSGPHSPGRTSGGNEKPVGKAVRRRCCGMPVWLFVVVFICLFLVILAAVLIPIFVVVIPHSRHSGTASANALSTCSSALTCLNGGTNILTSENSCECLCTNGFSGEICSVRSGVDCTSLTTDAITNATVGTSLPSLLTGALSTYNMNLNASTMLSLFNSANLSCTSENALVWFPGLSTRSFKQPVMLRPLLGERKVAVAPPSVTPTTLLRRQNAATMNGIVFAMSTSTPTVNTPSSTAASSTTTATATSSSSLVPHDANTLNFARTVVLYIFQSSASLTVAETALQKLQAALGTSSTANGNAVDLGSGWTVDLMTKTLSDSKGSVV